MNTDNKLDLTIDRFNLETDKGDCPFELFLHAMHKLDKEFDYLYKRLEVKYDDLLQIKPLYRGMDRKTRNVIVEYEFEFEERILQSHKIDIALSIYKKLDLKLNFDKLCNIIRDINFRYNDINWNNWTVHEYILFRW